MANEHGGTIDLVGEVKTWKFVPSEPIVSGREACGEGAEITVQTTFHDGLESETEYFVDGVKVEQDSDYYYDIESAFNKVWESLADAGEIEC